MQNDFEDPNKIEFSEFSDTLKETETELWSPEALKKLSDEWDRQVKLWTKEELEESEKGWERFFTGLKA